jgi:hypothetical protein
MTLEQATAQQRMGQSAIRRLANALLVPDGSTGIEGIYAERPMDAVVGGAGMQSRDLSFRAISSELEDDLARGAQCSLFIGPQRVLLHGRFEVRHREDNLLIDTALLDLERAA